MYLKAIFLPICLIMMSFSATSQSSEDAKDYLVNVTGSLEEFRVETWNILKYTVNTNGSSAELENRIQLLANKIHDSRKEVNLKDGFYGDLAAKVAMSVYLRNAREILTDDFKKIRSLERNSEESFEDMEKYLLAQNKANDRLSNAGERLDDELKRFAKRYKLEVTEDKSLIAQKIEKASLALSYYNQVYLSFFKVYHQKLAVYEALKTEDLEKIGIELELLDDYTNTSLGRLMILDSFMEDDNLNTAATAILNQFKYEADKVFPTAIRAIEKKHIFNMAQEVFNSIPETDRTSDDVDHLNSLIDPLNGSIEDQQKMFLGSETKRQQLFNNWNTEIVNFFANYLS